MSTGHKKVNRIHVLYNANHPPYLYGAVQIVDGDVTNLRSERPFVISKRRPGAPEVVYGTVVRVIEKIHTQVSRLDDFRSRTQRALRAAGVVPQDPEASLLPDSVVSDKIIDEQEDLIEEVLQAVSVHIRVLSEVLPNKCRQREVPVHDYDDSIVATIRLDQIADLLLHNRYVLVRSPHVVDLLSDKQFMSKTPQMGLKIDFTEYIAEVGKTVQGITVKDLVGKLWGMTKALTPSSSIRDIIFLIQNLYTLGGAVLGTDVPVEAGPLKTVLDRVGTRHLQRLRTKTSGPRRQTPVTLTFTTPRFYLESDLDNKQIRVEMNVNGHPERLVMGNEKFFAEVSAESGNGALYTAWPR